MIAVVWAKLKAWLRFVYDWITVLTASLVGVPAVLIELLDQLGAVNIAPLVGPDLALKIVTAVAIAKAALAFIASRLGSKQD